MKHNKKWFRMWKILYFAFSVLMRVYWYRISRKSEEKREQLWEKIGQDFRQTLFELEGLLIKVGQFLSIRSDVFPTSFIEQIQDLVDHVPPSSWEEVQVVLESEWGGTIEDKLQSIDPNVVASASIGEVYQGKLKDGTIVAIKVQRPTIGKIMKTDFRSLAIIIWFVHHFVRIPRNFIHFKLLFKELKMVIERELDYKKEMETIDHFRHRFQQFPKLIIPKVYHELCTSKVLVMEWVSGTRITDIEYLEKNKIDREELSERLFRLFISQWLEAGIFHADPHAGNVMVKEDGTIVLLDFGMVGEISKKDATDFQELLEAVVLKNYAKAAKIIIDLGFLLPEANRKMIANLLKDALAFDLSQLKGMDLFIIKKEINELIKSLPVQVPTRFIFLGRSFVTIEGMLHIISPNQELLEIARSAFMYWLKQGNHSKWRLLARWVNAQPLFQFFHTMADLAEVPQMYLSLKETMQQREFFFALYENRKKQMSLFIAVGLIGSLFGLYMNQLIVLDISAGVAGISFIHYVVCMNKQRKWLKSIEKK
ncbi:AarF/UbiB family protein [Bacillus sp. FJAT-50079]|uniref:ABC1 kinase family protein n=1 Tax=Bacillus sp. FJAT-50079 TaxID=2833577 RepID=UPI001BC95C92|nr:AarF/UbiB family protein [Bacillus sp. FJAT-50079]MBS4210681.1 AarF/ABC1/UbiB kinase family protein [Bacillus sp. FJAT-50079]